jgi:hypothetical protein
MSKTDLNKRELVAVGDALAEMRSPVTRSALPMAGGLFLGLVGSVLTVIGTRDLFILGGILALVGTLLVIFGVYQLGRNVDRAALASDAVLAVVLRIEGLLERDDDSGDQA